MKIPTAVLRVIPSVCLLTLAVSGFNRPAEGLSWPFGKREEQAEAKIPQRELPKRYAKVALTADPANNLSVVFEASEGTTTGYDTVHYSVGPAAKPEKVKVLTAKPKREATRVTCSFPSLTVDVPFGNGEHKGSCAVRFCFCSVKAANETFCVFTNTTVKAGSTKWQYDATGRMKPSTTAKKAPVLRFSGTPTLKVTTKPDKARKGHLGIGIEFATGENAITCKKNGKALDATIELKTREGKVVHKATDKIDKFAFG